MFGKITNYNSRDKKLKVKMTKIGKAHGQYHKRKSKTKMLAKNIP